MKSILELMEISATAQLPNPINYLIIKKVNVSKLK